MSRCKHNRTEQAREGNRTKLCKWHLKSNDNTHTRQTDGAPLTMRDEKGNRTKKMQRRSNEERRIRWRITLALRCFAGRACVWFGQTGTASSWSLYYFICAGAALMK